MLGIDAASKPAFVIEVVSGRYRIRESLVASAMRVHRFPRAINLHAESTVAVLLDVTKPQPAAAIRLRNKQRFKSRTERHVLFSFSISSNPSLKTCAANSKTTIRLRIFWV